MPALTTTAAHTSQVVRPSLDYVVLFKEEKFSEALAKPSFQEIARTRAANIASILIQALVEVDPEGEYNLVTSRQKQFDYCLVDLRMQPNMLIAEAIGRTEAALLHKELVKIDPSNQIRYAIARVGQLDIQG